MRDCFIVGSKLLGMYFLYWALISLPASISIAFSLFSSRSVFEGLPIADLIASVLSGLVMVIFALILLFKTDWVAGILDIADRTQGAPRLNDGMLRSGIILIGIYIFCTRIGNLAQVYAEVRRARQMPNPFAATQPGGLTFSPDFIGPLVTLGAPLGLVLGSKYIAAFLERDKIYSSERSPSPDRE